MPARYTATTPQPEPSRASRSGAIFVISGLPARLIVRIVVFVAGCFFFFLGGSSVAASAATSSLVAPLCSQLILSSAASPAAAFATSAPCRVATAESSSSSSKAAGFCAEDGEEGLSNGGEVRLGAGLETGVCGFTAAIGYCAAQQNAGAQREQRAEALHSAGSGAAAAPCVLSTALRCAWPRCVG